MKNLKHEKILAAKASVELVQEGMRVGLGSGSTAAFMIQKLGVKVANGLSIKAVPSSDKSAQLAREAGIPLITLKDAGTLDINIDGADEFDSMMQLIKGGGGALLREKILAHHSRFNVIIADSSKQVERLGEFKLPIETIPFATHNIISELGEMGLSPQLRKTGNTLYSTDENNYIVDVDILGLDDLSQLEDKLIHIPGVVETGLFLKSTDLIIVGKGDATIRIER